MENKKGFAINHHEIALDPNLSPRDYWVYGVLQSFRNGKTGKCFPAYDTIISRTGGKIKRTALYESITSLEEASYLTVHRKGGKVSHYTFPLLSQPIRYSERGESPQRITPVRPSTYKQEENNKNDYEQERPDYSGKNIRQMVAEGMKDYPTMREKILKKMSMPSSSTPNDFDEITGYAENDMRENVED